MEKLTFKEFCSIMENHANNENENPINGVIVFTEDSFEKEYSSESRSYKVSSNNKYFQHGKISNSLFGSCLDGTDIGVRLDWYMYGNNKWKIEYCYML